MRRLRVRKAYAKRMPARKAVMTCCHCRRVLQAHRQASFWWNAAPCLFVVPKAGLSLQGQGGRSRVMCCYQHKYPINPTCLQLGTSNVSCRLIRPLHHNYPSAGHCSRNLRCPPCQYSCLLTTLLTLKGHHAQSCARQGVQSLERQRLRSAKRTYGREGTGCCKEQVRYFVASSTSNSLQSLLARSAVELSSAENLYRWPCRQILDHTTPHTRIPRSG